MKIHNMKIYINDGSLDEMYCIEVSHSNKPSFGGGYIWQSGELWLTQDQGEPIMDAVIHAVQDHIDKMKKQAEERARQHE